MREFWTFTAAFALISSTLMGCAEPGDSASATAVKQPKSEQPIEVSESDFRLLELELGQFYPRSVADFDKLSPNERIVFIAHETIGSVNAGGFAFLYQGEYARIALEAPRALRVVDLPDLADIVDAANALLTTDEVSQIRNLEPVEMEKETASRWATIDNRFWSKSDMDIVVLRLLRYIKFHLN